MRLLFLIFFIGCTAAQTNPKTPEQFEKVQTPKMTPLGSGRISKCNCNKLQNQLKKARKENNDLREVLRRERIDYQVDCGEVLK